MKQLLGHKVKEFVVDERGLKAEIIGVDYVELVDDMMEVVDDENVISVRDDVRRSDFMVWGNRVFILKCSDGCLVRIFNNKGDGMEVVKKCLGIIDC